MAGEASAVMGREELGIGGLGDDAPNDTIEALVHKLIETDPDSTDYRVLLDRARANVRLRLALLHHLHARLWDPVYGSEHQHRHRTRICDAITCVGGHWALPVLRQVSADADGQPVSVRDHAACLIREVERELRAIA